MPSIADLFLQLQQKLSSDVAYNDRQHAYGQLLRSLVQGNFQFDDKDMTRIWKEGRLNLDEEGIYSLAVEHGNKSAARSMESKLRRPPYILFDRRMALGQTRWIQGRCSRISNIDDSKVVGAHSSLIKLPFHKNHVAMGTSSITKEEIKTHEKNIQAWMDAFPNIIVEKVKIIQEKVRDAFQDRPWFDMIMNVGGTLAWTLKPPEEAAKWLSSILRVDRDHGAMYLQFEKFSIADMQHLDEIVHHATVNTLENLRQFDTHDPSLQDAVAFKTFWKDHGTPVSLLSWRSIEASMMMEDRISADQKIKWFTEPHKHGISREVLKSELPSAVNVVWQGIALHKQEKFEHNFHMEDYRDHLQQWSPVMQRELTRLFLATQNSLADGQAAKKVRVDDPANLESHLEACFQFWISNGDPWVQPFIQTWIPDANTAKTLVEELHMLHQSLGIDDPKILARNHAKALVRHLNIGTPVLRKTQEMELPTDDWDM